MNAESGNGVGNGVGNVIRAVRDHALAEATALETENAELARRIRENSGRIATLRAMHAVVGSDEPRGSTA